MPLSRAITSTSSHFYRPAPITKYFSSVYKGRVFFRLLSKMGFLHLDYLCLVDIRVGFLSHGDVFFKLYFRSWRLFLALIWNGMLVLLFVFLCVYHTDFFVYYYYSSQAQELSEYYQKKENFFLLMIFPDINCAEWTTRMVNDRFTFIQHFIISAGNYWILIGW